ncbi:hypothetical protein QE177_15135 (plasmid) [Arsenophonus sp. aPb]|uniref:hypothetical protein n=1 Tax=Arsenophonus sp. aPb TaxID=3041619 RepID=UPI0024699C9A|nr:hypothetical protein [Arsenophonus sp. aPb]WGL99833.1 hypothetical protein QE177_15135 [Arsenophonus sp. aPb]
MTIYNELPEDIRPYMTDFKEKEQAYQQARQSFAQKEHDVELIKNRKAETQKALKEYDTQWRQLFHENKGEMTKQMKALRTECVLAKETLEEFNNLIAVAEKDITPYQWQLGEAASQLIDAQHKLIARYATHLFNHFMQEQGKVLNAVMRFYYYSLSVNEINNAGASKVYEGVNDKAVMFKDFTDKLMVNWRTNLTHYDREALPLKINFQLNNEVYLDQQLKPTPWEIKRASLSKKT